MDECKPLPPCCMAGVIAAAEAEGAAAAEAGAAAGAAAANWLRAVAVQVQIVSKVCERFIVLWLYALKP